ncbi:signal peptidase I [Amycolatopsis sp. 195334CR]|uniref:signal peptidase I n=1 Tax=Amycolatopsis sp. 195334CR TaxID=2814588 RepID=UPI001A8C6A9A|nr:signal peptidase I [Amycolatopsis sp. 195334CR]MBN6035054.1 signal peptidase I [Amycolatopsis sp. 195334CR]
MSEIQARPWWWRGAPFILLPLLIIGGFLVAFGFLHPRITAALDGSDQAVQTAVADRSMGAAYTPGSLLLLGEPAEVHRGDVVVVDAGAWQREGQLVSRVIGLGGDVVVCCGERDELVVNGIPVYEEYLGPDRGTFPFTVTIPPNSVFLLGDNRGNAFDSRAFSETPERAALPMSAVRGRVVAERGADGTERTLPQAGAFVAAGLAEPRQPDVLPGPLTWAVTAGIGVGAVAVLTGFAMVVARVVRKRASGGPRAVAPDAADSAS